MKIDFDEEQQAFARKVEQLFEQGYDDATRRRALTDPAFQLPSLWKALAAQGLVGINVPASLGGSAVPGRDAALSTHIVMQAMGRHLAPEPFMSSAVVGTSLIAETAEESLQKLMLPAMTSGRVRLTLAALEADDPCNFRHVATRAASKTHSWVLDGRKVGILDAPYANWMIMPARTSGNIVDETGISLFLVSRTAHGVQMEYGRGPDGSEIASATLRGVEVATNDLIGALDQGYAPLQRAVQRGISALCSEATGVMDRLLSMCNAHLVERQKSGLAAAEGSMLRQCIAELQSAAEQAHSATLLAVAAAATSSGDDDGARRKAVANAKAVVGEAARLFDREAVRVMTGAGETEQLLVGHCVRRLMVIDATWGNAEYHSGAAGLMS